jgi:hypothetical protein
VQNVCLKTTSLLWYNDFEQARYGSLRAEPSSKNGEAKVVYRGKIKGGHVVTDPSDCLPEGASVSIEVIRPVPKVVGGVQSLDVTETKLMGPTELTGTSFSSEALLFCREKGLLVDVNRAIDIARNCFSIISNPAVNLVHDGDADDASYLSIEIQVSGAVKDNVMSHRKFAREAAALLGSKREIITLHYDII